MNICFLARPSFDEYSIAILQNLRSRFNSEIGGFFITSNSSESKYVLDNIDNVTVCETSEYIKSHWNEFTFEKLLEFECRYDCRPIWKYIYSDRFLINRSYDYVIKITVGLFAFFEDIFSNNTIDFYYSEAIATLQCYVAYLVGKKYNVNYIAQMCARGSLDSSYHYFVKDEFQHNAKFDNNYRNNHYSEKERQFADNYLREFEEKDCPPPAMNLVRSVPRMDMDFWLAVPKFLVKRFDPKYNNRYSYIYYKGYMQYLNPIVFFFRYQKSKKYYHDADYSQKYVYYPLHYQPEASTCVCAEKYEKQLFYIDSWAKSLPADTVLYVKEHYAQLGHRDPHFYVELKKYPNVKLITPFESSRKLIENSTAVTTLTGTAGFEAMLLRKPVIICGNSVYENAPGVIKLDDIFDNYVQNIAEWERPSRDEVINYLCACIRSYYKGNAYAQNYHELIEKEINNICDSLFEELQAAMKRE